MTTQVTDHVAQALARIAGRDSKPNIVAFISILAQQTQETEDAWWQLFAERGVSAAVGDQLDDLGEIVGQPRNGLSDSDYQRHISARIAANNSDGLVNDFLRVSRSVLDDASLTLRFQPQYPAGAILHVESGLLTSDIADILIAFLRDTRAGGVRIQAHYLTALPGDSFTFGSVTSVTATVGIGATVIAVLSTAGFPDSGDLIIEDTAANQESCSYTSKDSTNFYGVTGVTILHPASGSGSEVKVGDSTTMGFSDTGAPATGGAFSSVLE